MEKKVDKKIIDALNSGKESTVITTIYKLQTSGTADILPYLFNLFFTSGNEKIRDGILKILNNVKDKNAIPYFAEAVKKYKGQEHYDELISSCWQNGLDFSPEIRLFVDLVIEQDIQTAIEAFSVVEGNISELSGIDREKEAIYISSKIKAVDDDRKKLVREMWSVVENIQGPFKPDMN